MIKRTDIYFIGAFILALLVVGFFLRKSECESGIFIKNDNNEWVCDSEAEWISDYSEDNVEVKVETKKEIIQPVLGANFSNEDKSSYRMEMEQIDSQLQKIRENTLTGCEDARDFYWWVDENFDRLKINEASWDKIRAEMTSLKGVCDNDFLKHGGK